MADEEDTVADEAGTSELELLQLGGSAHRKKGNILPTWGNEKTMNLNSMVLTNIQQSPYFKIQLSEFKTYHEVVDQIYVHVNHLEPWEKGSRRTSGQIGMCGGVRGVGAGGIVSSAFCLLYKLFTLKLTRKQLNGLLNHQDSPYLRGMGFMYIRFCQPPPDLWEWYESYLDDHEEIEPKAGGGDSMTIGQMVRHFLTRLDWYGTLFPRIPVPVAKQIDQKLIERRQKHQQQNQRFPHENGRREGNQKESSGKASGARPGLVDKDYRRRSKSPATDSFGRRLSRSPRPTKARVEVSRRVGRRSPSPAQKPRQGLSPQPVRRPRSPSPVSRRKRSPSPRQKKALPTEKTGKDISPSNRRNRIDDSSDEKKVINPIVKRDMSLSPTLVLKMKKSVSPFHSSKKTSGSPVSRKKAPSPTLPKRKTSPIPAVVRSKESARGTKTSDGSAKRKSSVTPLAREKYGELTGARVKKSSSPEPRKRLRLPSKERRSSPSRRKRSVTPPPSERTRVSPPHRMMASAGGMDDDNDLAALIEREKERQRRAKQEAERKTNDQHPKSKVKSGSPTQDAGKAVEAAAATKPESSEEHRHKHKSKKHKHHKRDRSDRHRDSDRVASRRVVKAEEKDIPDGRKTDI